MSPPTLAQQIHHVLEVLEVSALIAGRADPLGVLHNRSVHDLSHARLCPRWMTSAPWDCKTLRMMLIAAS